MFQIKLLIKFAYRHKSQLTKQSIAYIYLEDEVLHVHKPVQGSHKKQSFEILEQLNLYTR